MRQRITYVRHCRLCVRSPQIQTLDKFQVEAYIGVCRDSIDDCGAHHGYCARFINYLRTLMSGTTPLVKRTERGSLYIYENRDIVVVIRTS